MTEMIGIERIGMEQPAGRPIPYVRVRPMLRAWTPRAPRKTKLMRAAVEAPAQKIDAETVINIQRIEDIVQARQAGRLLVEKMGFSGSRITLVTTAISELARNIVLYARFGQIVLSRLNSGSQMALVVAANDEGPGIVNIERVLAGGMSTSGGLGLGLCGLKRIVDEFEIRSQPGKGTQVVVRIRSGH